MNILFFRLVLVLFFTLFSTQINAYCAGVVTLTSDIGEVRSIPLTNNKETFADLFIHEKSIACQNDQDGKCKAPCKESKKQCVICLH